ncbi:hypothetical protein BC936DRAFT_146061 [Jimgerdemannia flammicorona]|uniref:Thioredoxin domain-containing protein n=1 Tax=Jimgerdemannia flammicorona TaxID=994334 RepID=A0A433D8I3_9FUNG|nr:hypothetical protein BC936DRAFT_146061 [Jimgerdemannia flammicorona]
MIGTVIQPLKGLEFIKGEEFVIGGPIEEGKNKVLVVEFWATWCPPCRTSIPHITEVAHKYKTKDVTIVGVTNEQDENTVKNFVEDMGDKMDYTVAIDLERSARNALFVPSKASGIPTAFILENNKVVWFGHPMDPAFEQTLDQSASRASARAGSEQGGEEDL